MFARTAEADWFRACEHVRRSAPVIGPIGESRAFLEGGWAGSSPAVQNVDAIPDGEKRSPEGNINITSTSVSFENEPRPHGTSPGISSISPSQTHPTLTENPNLPSQSESQSTSTSASRPSGASATHSPSSFPQPVPPFVTSVNADSVRSIESLSSFPTPPGHFPIPTLKPTGSSNTTSVNSSASIVGSANEARVAAKLTESPISVNERLDPEPFSTPALTSDDNSSRSSGHRPATPPTPSPNIRLQVERDQDTVTVKGVTSNMTVVNAGDTQPLTLTPVTPVNRYQEEPAATPRRPGVSSRVERSDSLASTGSIVASMRNKWDKNVRVNVTSVRYDMMPY
jgi:hypothetical protein